MCKLLAGVPRGIAIGVTLHDSFEEIPSKIVQALVYKFKWSGARGQLESGVFRRAG